MKNQNSKKPRKRYHSAVEFQRDFQDALRSGITPHASAHQLLALAKRGNMTAVRLVAEFMLGERLDMPAPVVQPKYSLSNLTTPEIEVLRWLLLKSKTGQNPGPPPFIPEDCVTVRQAWAKFWKSYVADRLPKEDPKSSNSAAARVQ